MAANPNTYYEILGVAQDASNEEIRSAFRKLARLYHPDVNKNKDSEERFKKISIAFDVLINPDLRAKYDQELEKASKPAGQTGQPAPDAAGSDHHSYSGLDVRADVTVTFEAAMGGEVVQVKYQRRKPCPACHGHKVILGVRCLKCHATGATLQDEILPVQIPAGAGNGVTLTMTGKGHIDPDNGYAGRLILNVNVEPHPFLRREGDDLVCEIGIHMVDAALGTQVTIPTLEGNRTLIIPPATAPETRLVLAGMGVGGWGSQRVIVHVEIPRQNFLQNFILRLYRRIAMGGRNRAAGSIFRLNP